MDGSRDPMLYLRFSVGTPGFFNLEQDRLPPEGIVS